MLALLFSSLAASVTAPPEEILPKANGNMRSMYSKTRNVWFMTFMVAFLMMFIKRYEWGVCLATMLSVISSFICYVFVQNVARTEPFDAKLQADGVVCAVTCAISIGVFLGSLSH
jgi:ammonium transporter Rh